MAGVAAAALLLSAVEVRPAGVRFEAGPIRAGLIAMPSFGPLSMAAGDPREGCEFWWRAFREGWLGYLALERGWRRG